MFPSDSGCCYISLQKTIKRTEILCLIKDIFTTAYPKLFVVQRRVSEKKKLICLLFSPVSKSFWFESLNQPEPRTKDGY